MRMMSRGRAGADQRAARIAALGTQIDDPIGGADHVEVVLDDEQRVAGLDQPPECAQQFRDVVEVQAGGRLVEQEQRARGVGAAPVRRGAASTPCARVLGQVSGELEPLRLAAGERRHRLAQTQVIEAHFGERRKAQADLGVAGEERQRLGDGQIEHVGDAHAARPSARRACTSSTSAR